MAIFLGIKPGETRDGQAGATYRVVKIALAADAKEVVIGDRRFAVGGTTLGVWHGSDAGTWHGIVDAILARTVKVRELPQLKVGMDDDADLKGMAVESGSGGADYAAIVAKVTRPIAVVTSGYRGRRDWRITVVEPTADNGLVVTFDGTPSDYRARFAVAETL